VNATKSSQRPGPEALAKAKGSFTSVQAGEKLADVARRVYGTATATRSLWEANRDQVALIDSPLPSGILLRTP
jgi:nucleoid-associated protein YgaU